MSDTTTKRRSPGGIGITRRAGKFEATYNVPKEQLPPGAPRKRITAWGDSEIAATAALIDKLRTTELAPALPGKTTAADEKEIRDWLGPDGEDVKSPQPAAVDGDKGLTLEAWVKEWKANWISPNLQDSTKKIYFGHIDTYILPYLGHYDMNELYLNTLKHKWWEPLGQLRKVKDGLITDQPLLGNSVKANIYKTLRLLITTCHKKHQTMIAIDSAMLGVPESKRPETDREVRDAAKHLQKLFLDEPNKDDPRWSLFMLALLGVRQAERLAIRVQDIDEDDEDGPTLNIHQQLDFDVDKGGWYIKNTTKNGDPRTLPLIGAFLEAVEKQLEWRREWEARDDWNPDPKFADLLFLQPGGKLWTRRQDSPAWHEYVGPGIRGHLARHITGHMLARQGVSIETAKVLLGHKTEGMAYYYRVASNMNTRRELEEAQQRNLNEATVAYIQNYRKRA